MKEGYLALAKLVFQKPSIISKQKTILLLSHMRANTSLIGHILGDHPEINGYYEMHIGYYSWKSKIRQKLRFFAAHSDEQVKPFLFDKVLHSDHEVTPSFMLRDDVTILICIREPIKSVQSIVSLYAKNDPSHEFATEAGAAEYYIERCNTLTDIARNLHSKFTFYSAESLVKDTNATLQSLTKAIGLRTALSSTFKTKKLTGVGTTGDNSGNLNNGKVVEVKSEYKQLDLPEAKIDELKRVYVSALQIMKNGHCHVK